MLSNSILWYYSAIFDHIYPELEPEGKMSMEFKSAKLETNSMQVESWAIAEENLTEIDSGNFSCSVSSQATFARVDEIRACPLPEPNATCSDASSLTNYSALMAGSELNSLLAEWTSGVLLECRALNPYKRTPFAKVLPASWPIRLIPRTTTTGFFFPIRTSFSLI